METYLEHHGILGQKWGVRRYQNEDGTLTDAGKQRLSYKVGEKRLNNRQKRYRKLSKKSQYSLNENTRDKALNLHLKSEHTRRAQQKDDEIFVIGSKTIKQRTLTSISAATISAGSAYAAIALETAIPLAAIPATAIAAGRLWYKSYH